MVTSRLGPALPDNTELAADVLARVGVPDLPDVAVGTVRAALPAFCAAGPVAPAIGDGLVASAASALSAGPRFGRARDGRLAVVSERLASCSCKPDALAAPSRLALGTGSVAGAAMSASRSKSACREADASSLSRPVAPLLLMAKSKASARSLGVALLAGTSSKAGLDVSVGGGNGAARISAATSTGTATGGVSGASPGSATGRVSPALSASLFVSAAPGLSGSLP